jgi:hypothetical protein
MGKLVERDPVLEATQAADDTPVQSPAASNQPVNNAAISTAAGVATMLSTALSLAGPCGRAGSTRPARLAASHCLRGSPMTAR